MSFCFRMYKKYDTLHENDYFILYRFPIQSKICTYIYLQ